MLTVQMKQLEDLLQTDFGGEGSSKILYGGGGGDKFYIDKTQRI